LHRHNKEIKHRSIEIPEEYSKQVNFICQYHRRCSCENP